jgi:aryl-phospho-beta-D-glucosidase BglC (GH1 family)
MREERSGEMALNRKIKGVNLGSWLLMEGYILGGRNIPESQFKESLKTLYGEKPLKEFERLFRDNFIKEEDFKNISLMGANAIRVPFNYRLIENSPFSYCEEGFSYLEKAFSWAEKYNLGIILDLHAAPGAQNCDWHSDSNGSALFWEEEEYRNRAISLWEKVVDRFKNEPSLLGYDVLNEPVLGKKDTDILKQFYRQLIKHVRAIDRKNTIFLEGDIWAQRINFLEDLIEENICISIHVYLPLDFTFNFTPFGKFPGNIKGEPWDDKAVYRYLEPYFVFSLKNKVKIYVGEFGINWRGGHWGELDWLESVLNSFEQFGFDYTYWTYKAIASYVFPDGLYQYIPNCKYISREGPVYGWENYIPLWEKEKESIVDFWQTKNFTPNQNIISTLNRFFKK